MRKIILIVLISCRAILTLEAQNNKAAIYDAFVKGDMEKWRNILTDIEISKPSSVCEKLELLNFYYGYIGYSLGIKNKKQAAIYIEKGDKLLEELKKTNSSSAELYALKAAFIGFKIGVSPYKAPFIGQSSIKNAKKALSLDRDNIQGNIEQANILYYSPSAFGGDKNEAKIYYQKAISLFEKNPSKTLQNWLYLSLLTKIGQIQESEGKYTEAKQTYEKILKVEPNYKYVRDGLLPAL